MSDGVGLDKVARLKAKRDAQTEANKPEPLEREFPWLCEPFDPTFFGLRGAPDSQE